MGGWGMLNKGQGDYWNDFFTSLCGKTGKAYLEFLEWAGVLGDWGTLGGQNDKIQDAYQDPYIFLISETRGVQWGIRGDQGVTKTV